MKKLIALLMALVMTMSLATVAWGATTVTTIDELTNAVAAGGDIVLGADMEISTSLRVSTDVNLDLNGHTLVGPHNYNGGSNLYAFIVESGTFTLTDTSAAQTGEIACKYSGIETKGGTFIMNGGKITSADLTMAVAIVNYGGSVIINDGVVNAYDTAITTQAYFTATATTEVAGGEVNLLSSTNNTAVFETGGQYNTGATNVEVTGGDINSNGAAFAVYDTTTGTAAMEVSGGSFDADVTTYLAPGLELTDDGTGNYIAITATTGNTAATKFYVSDASATDGWKLLDSFAATKPTDLFVEADYDEYVPEGNLSHYDINGAYYAVAAMNVAEYKLVYGNKVVYLNPVDADEIFYQAQAKVFTGVTADKDACGKVLVNKADLKKTYYVVTLEDTDGNEQTFYFVKVNAGGAATLLVNGKIVEANLVDTFIEHNWVGNDIDKDGNYVSVKCDRCGKVATLYANKTAAGKDAEFVPGFGWITATAASYVSAGATDTKVESAETFDAGIAMYVGMSVMAAAGSAVVIGKKKD